MGPNANDAGTFCDPPLDRRPTTSESNAGLIPAKHGVFDGRWGSARPSALCGRGLAQVRRASPGTALALHCAVNACGVLLGHATGRDQF